MVLLEGRKEDIYKKYKGQIDAERKLNSSSEPISIYDLLINEPFLQQTNFKYLEPIIQQYYFFNGIYPRQGKELEELEPNLQVTSVRAIQDKRQFVRDVVPKVEFFDKNKDKYPKKDLREYFGELFEKDFISFTVDLITQMSKKQISNQVKKEIDKIYEDDTILIVKPKTHAASCYYGAGTKWCTTSKDNATHFNSYTRNANLYYVIRKGKNVSDRFYKIAINLQSNQKLIDADWYDVQDNLFNISQKDLFLTIISDKAVNLIYEDLKQLKDSWFKTELIPSIERTPLIRETKNIILSKSKNIFLSLNFFDFELVDYLGDDQDENEYFQRFEATYILQQLDKNGVVLVEPGEFSFFYEKGLINGLVLDGESQYVINLSFEGDDDYYNMYLGEKTSEYYLSKDVNFNLGIKSTIGLKLTSIVNSNYFKNKVSEYAELEGVNTKYTQAGYTFTKGGKLTRALINYIDSLPEGGVGNKLDFLKRTGQVTITPEGSFSKTGRKISLQGYLSSFFSAVKQAGILKKPEGKNGYIKGPNFDKFKEKYF